MQCVRLRGVNLNDSKSMLCQPRLSLGHPQNICNLIDLFKLYDAVLLVLYSFHVNIVRLSLTNL